VPRARKETCSNCGRKCMEKIIVLGLVMKTKKYEHVCIRRCFYCGHLASVNQWVI